MRGFKKILKEMDILLNELVLFDNLVTSVLVFLVIYFPLSYFEVTVYVPIGIAVVFFFVNAVRRIRKSKMLLVEEKYAPLREKLRTAADNAGKDNPIVDELEYEVTREMKNVGVSLFINPKVLSLKIFAAVILSFLVIFSSTFNIHFGDLPIFNRQSTGDGDADGPIAAKDLPIPLIQKKKAELGDADVATLGDDEIQIRIKPVDFKVGVKEEGEVEKRNFNTIFPREVDLKETSAFEEEIALEDQKLVQNYINNINNIDR